MINNRPGWANIGGDRITNINNVWGNQIGGLRNWGGRHPNRIGRYNRWGNNVRHHWGHYHHHHNWFGPGWWNNHYHALGGWHYYHRFNAYPFNYWWTIPTFTSCVNWFNWSAPVTVWQEPIYYDYGTGGNIVYENNVVYINGQEAATAEEFAQSAAVLATVPPPADEEAAAAAEWLPLGTFAVAADEKDSDPNRVIQLAVSKDGIIAGTLYNTETDEAQTVQGAVDKETQRVAFRIGESEDFVVETGLYNLTQEESPILVHFGADRVENYLLVRLEAPEENEATSL